MIGIIKGKLTGDSSFTRDIDRNEKLGESSRYAGIRNLIQISVGYFPEKFSPFENKDI